MYELNENTDQIISDVEEVYEWISGELEQNCRTCGKCCDFAQYGHRLYVTTPEFLYFLERIDKGLLEMVNGICPYLAEGRCSAYEHRFAACRIFSCGGDREKQHEICELTIKKMRGICENYSLPYRYVEIKYALNRPELWMQ